MLNDFDEKSPNFLKCFKILLVRLILCSCTWISFNSCDLNFLSAFEFLSIYLNLINPFKTVSCLHCFNGRLVSFWSSVQFRGLVKKKTKIFKIWKYISSISCYNVKKNLKFAQVWVLICRVSVYTKRNFENFLNLNWLLENFSTWTDYLKKFSTDYLKMFSTDLEKNLKKFSTDLEKVLENIQVL